MSEVSKTGSRHFWRYVSTCAGLALTTLAVACGGSSDVTGPPGGGTGGGGAVAVASVAVSPASTALLVGVVDTTKLGVTTLTATPMDANGQKLSGRATTWSSDAASVATVGPTGIVNAVGIGSANITATIEGKTASVPVTVSAAEVSQVTVTPQASTIKVGATETLDIQLLDASGNKLNSYHLGHDRYIARLYDPTIISLSSNQVTGVAAGTATIIIKADNNAGTTATITVTP